MRRAPVALAAVAALAGCGGSAKKPPAAQPPHIPRALAQSWAQQANTVAQEIAAGNTCAARDNASALAASVSESAARVPIRLRAQLTSAVAALPGRIQCNPAPPEHPPHPPHPSHGHGHGHDKHGNDQGD